MFILADGVYAWTVNSVCSLKKGLASSLPDMSHYLVVNYTTLHTDSRCL